MQPATVSSLDITVMALREKCMDYFKGNVHGSVARNNDISLINIQEYLPNRRYQYQRRELEAQAPRIVTLKQVPLFRIQKQPNTITFYSRTLQRSPELQELQHKMEAFVREYLPGVRVLTSEELPDYA